MSDDQRESRRDDTNIPQLENILQLLTKYQVDDFTHGSLHIKMRLTQNLPVKKTMTNGNPGGTLSSFPFPEQQYHAANKTTDITQEELAILGMSGVIPTVPTVKKARTRKVKDQ